MLIQTKKMSESDKTPQRAVMHFYFQLGKSTLETVELMNRACNERKVNRRLVYRWFQSFREENVSLRNQQRTERWEIGGKRQLRQTCNRKIVVCLRVRKSKILLSRWRKEGDAFFLMHCYCR